jgi:hypothetical protein
MAGNYVGWDQVLKQGHVALMKGVIDIGGHADQTKRTSSSCSFLPLVSISTPAASWFLAPLINLLTITTGKARAGAVELVIECQGSSIGSYSKQWLQQIHLSCSGTFITRCTALVQFDDIDGMKGYLQRNG